MREIIDVRKDFLKNLEKYGLYGHCNFNLSLCRWSSPADGLQLLLVQHVLPVTAVSVFSGMVILKTEQEAGRKGVDAKDVIEAFKQAESPFVFATYGGGIREVFGARGAGTPIDTFYFDAFTTEKDDSECVPFMLFNRPTGGCVFLSRGA